jgi:heme-degrading monooxygenase HmoA
MPGFISYKEFAAADGEGVAIVEFESNETLEAWRNHPEHRKAQERGRREFFDDYRIAVCSPIRDYRWRA